MIFCLRGRGGGGRGQMSHTFTEVSRIQKEISQQTQIQTVYTLTEVSRIQKKNSPANSNTKLERERKKKHLISPGRGKSPPAFPAMYGSANLAAVFFYSQLYSLASHLSEVNGHNSASGEDDVRLLQQVAAIAYSLHIQTK